MLAVVNLPKNKKNALAVVNLLSASCHLCFIGCFKKCILIPGVPSSMLLCLLFLVYYGVCYLFCYYLALFLLIASHLDRLPFNFMCYFIKFME